MHDGHLTLARIAQKPLDRAQFAFLSVCQSAKGSTLFPHESVHIAAGLQFAGFCSVVGTMWSIHDEYGPSMATNFYEHLFNSGATASDAAGALHLAVQQLHNDQVPLTQWVSFIHIGI
jgi:CHAT domain-containing protein